MNAIDPVDELVREYLLFRGFTATLKSFDQEKKADKFHGFQVDRVVDQISLFVSSSDLQGLADFWETLDKKFFSRLTSDFHSTVVKLLSSLRKRYLVIAFQAGKHDKIREFFETLTDDLVDNPEWNAWFALPYMKTPESDSQLEPYFSKQWSELLTASLHNFLSSVFRHMPLPTLLNFNQERLERKARECEIDALKFEMDRLSLELSHTLKSLSELQTKGSDSNLQKYNRPSSLTTPTHLADSMSNSSGLWSTPADSKVGTVDSASTSEGEMDDDGSGDESTLGLDPYSVVQEAVYADHGKSVIRTRCSPSGQHVASGSSDNTVRIWSERADCNAMIVFQSSILSLAWAPNTDKLLLSGTGNGNMKLWNVESKRVMLDMNAPSDRSRVLDLATNPAGSDFAVSSANYNTGSLSMWSMRTGKIVDSFAVDPVPVPIQSIHFNHNGSMLLAGGADGMIRIFDVATYSAIMGWPAHDGGVSCVRFTHDETSVLSAGGDGKITEWSLHQMGKSLRDYTIPGFTSERQQPGIELSVDADGGHFITTGYGDSAFIFSRSKSLPSMLLPCGSSPVQSVDWCGHRNMVALACGNSVRVMNLKAVKTSRARRRKSVIQM